MCVWLLLYGNLPQSQTTPLWNIGEMLSTRFQITSSPTPKRKYGNQEGKVVWLNKVQNLAFLLWLFTDYFMLTWKNTTRRLGNEAQTLSSIGDWYYIVAMPENITSL